MEPDRTPSAAPVLRFEERQSAGADERVFALTISHSALVRPKLTPFDRKLLAECSSPDATVADRLLGLELLARRIEEATL